MLTFAPLAGAHLAGADLRGADLRGADLQRVELLDADLRGADLRGANLQGTALEHLTDMVTVTIEDSPPGKPGRVIITHGVDPNLTGARYDAYTRWPTGFDPRGHGACRVSGDE